MEKESLMTRISEASNSLKLSDCKGFVWHSHKCLDKCRNRAQLWCASRNESQSVLCWYRNEGSIRTGSMTNELNSPDFVLACHICKKHGFSNRSKLRNYLKTRHCLHLASAYTGRPVDKITSQATLTAEVYNMCPSCTSFFETIEQVGEHAKAHLPVPTNASKTDNR